jgi:tetratricopeptide (TPR) repeat protein
MPPEKPAPKIKETPKEIEPPPEPAKEPEAVQLATKPPAKTAPPSTSATAAPMAQRVSPEEEAPGPESPTSAASSPEGSRERFQAGVTLFNQARFDAAAVEFEASYRLKPHFNILLNIARCHEASGRNRKAIRYYKRYLKEGGDDIPPVRRQEVEAKIESLKKK